MAVIDASVYVSLVNAHEKSHASSWTWFEDTQTRDEKIVAPVILLDEVASALSRGVGDPELANIAVQHLGKSSLIVLVPVTRSLAEFAAVIAAEHRIRGCDAVYVAVAAQLDDALVTLDQQQLKRAASIIRVRKP
ncbi:MAG: type II toxin-antitoxin system VapC family toxin [Chloroflexota bacterium]|nr:type II toxin-antitoxin system VapC family toxin [Chloroflexota bacterium]